MNPEPQRLSTSQKRLSVWRKAVTIIAGFKCRDGIVLCADTQETLGVAKRNIPKLRLEPTWTYGGAPTDDFAMAFCGATNNGPFVDKLTDVVWERTIGSERMDQACKRAEQAIKDVYKEFGQIYQPGFMPDAELIYGIKVDGESKLFHANGPIVIEERRYVSGGVGSYMADFICRQNHCFTFGQLIILAAYALFQTKNHVDGCGGDSHIAVLPNKGEARQLASREVDCVNKTVEMVDHYLADLLITCSDPEADFTQIENEVSLVLRLIEGYRKDYQAELQKWQGFLAKMDAERERGFEEWEKEHPENPDTGTRLKEPGNE